MFFGCSRQNSLQEAGRKEGQTPGGTDEPWRNQLWKRLSNSFEWNRLGVCRDGQPEREEDQAKTVGLVRSIRYIWPNFRWLRAIRVGVEPGLGGEKEDWADIWLQSEFLEVYL